VVNQNEPLWTKSLSKIDDLLFAVKAPQLIDTILISLAFLAIPKIYKRFKKVAPKKE